MWTSPPHVQTTLTIKSAQAPHEYRFPLHLPSGAAPTLNEDGSVIVIDTAGQHLGTFLAPWARDANGVEVPTQYHLNGNTLSQVVKFSDSTAFPIIADPKWLDNLWNGAKTVAGKLGRELNVRLHSSLLVPHQLKRGRSSRALEKHGKQSRSSEERAKIRSTVKPRWAPQPAFSASTQSRRTALTPGKIYCYGSIGRCTNAQASE